jgi:hypothetical protein
MNPLDEDDIYIPGFESYEYDYFLNNTTTKQKRSALKEMVIPIDDTHFVYALYIDKKPYTRYHFVNSSFEPSIEGLNGKKLWQAIKANKDSKKITYVDNSGQIHKGINIEQLFSSFFSKKYNKNINVVEYDPQTATFVLDNNMVLDADGNKVNPLDLYDDPYVVPDRMLIPFFSKKLNKVVSHVREFDNDNGTFWFVLTKDNYGYVLDDQLNDAKNNVEQSDLEVIEDNKALASAIAKEPVLDSKYVSQMDSTEYTFEKAGKKFLTWNSIRDRFELMSDYGEDEEEDYGFGQDDYGMDQDNDWDQDDNWNQNDW